MPQLEKKIQVPDTSTITDQTSLIKYLKDLGEVLSRYTVKLADLLNKGIRVADNLNAHIITITTAGANTEVTIAHTLKRIPAGYIILGMDKAANIYDSGTTWTATNIYIKASVATVAVKLLIV
jgi:hypothetical protein